MRIQVYLRYTPFIVLEQAASYLLFSDNLRKQVISRNLRSHNFERSEVISSSFSHKKVVNKWLTQANYLRAVNILWLVLLNAGTALCQKTNGIFVQVYEIVSCALLIKRDVL